MKKRIILSLLLIVSLLTITGCGDKKNTNQNSKQKTDQLTIELFYDNDSTFSKIFLNYYESLDESIKSKIVLNKNNWSDAYEDLSNNNPIRKKYNAIIKKLDITGCGVPFIVFNEEKYMCGFNDGREEEFMKLIKEYIKGD